MRNALLQTNPDDNSESPLRTDKKALQVKAGHIFNYGVSECHELAIRQNNVKGLAQSPVTPYSTQRNPPAFVATDTPTRNARSKLSVNPL